MIIFLAFSILLALLLIALVTPENFIELALTFAIVVAVVASLVVEPHFEASDDQLKRTLQPKGVDQ